ncbi:MAG: TonB-dependent siderophore receptor, partial [Opitutaceae bacterium]
MAGLSLLSPALGGESSSSIQTGETAIRLDEFTVSAGESSAYRSAGSITASGIGTRVSEIPIPISIVTAEFMRDSAAFELREALNFVPGVTTNPRTESSFTIRGFAGFAAYRNGHLRRQLFPTWNIDRVEVVKGASAIFFGVIRPGGVINYVTTRPVPGVRSSEAEITFGSDGFHRASVFHNEPLGSRAAIRLGGGFIEAEGGRQFEYKRERYLGAALLWRPADRHQITVGLETIRRKLFYLNAYGGRALSNSRFLFNADMPDVDQTATSAEAATRAWLDANGYEDAPTFDIFAPIYGPDDPAGATVALAADARSSLESRTVDAEYLLQIRDDLVWQTKLNHAYDRAAGLQPFSGERTPYADGSLRFRVEDWINIR